MCVCVAGGGIGFFDYADIVGNNRDVRDMLKQGNERVHGTVPIIEAWEDVHIYVLNSSLTVHHTFNLEGPTAQIRRY